jgi:hypothetical protein
MPTTIESGPARGSTSVSLKPTPRIHASKSAPVQSKPPVRLDPHVQAHEQPERVLPAPVVDDGVEDDERPVGRQGGVGLGEPCALFPSSKEPCRSEDFAEALSLQEDSAARVDLSLLQLAGRCEERAPSPCGGVYRGGDSA